jgi:DNA-binding NarL/FixJ family response regulator
MPTANEKTRRIRVVIADDNKQVRDKVVQLLQPDFEVVGTAADGNAAVEVVLLLKPEIVVLDISMPIRNGIEAAIEMKKNSSLSKTVFLTVHDDPDFVRAALNAGAYGYVIKSQMAKDLTAAIWEASEGRFFISPNCAITEGFKDIKSN